QHEDRRRRRCADPLAHFVARELRELAVEYHEVRRFLRVPPERGLAVVCGDDLVALLAQQRRDHPDERALVVDHEDRAQRNAGSAVARASGTVNAKTAPPPSGESSTQMSPPCPSTTRRDAKSPMPRSEERRVGKECRSRWSPDH